MIFQYSHADDLEGAYPEQVNGVVVSRQDTLIKRREDIANNAVILLVLNAVLLVCFWGFGFTSRSELLGLGVIDAAFVAFVLIKKREWFKKDFEVHLRRRDRL